MAKEYKCRYQRCLHPDEKVTVENAVADGGKHYHPDCYQTSIQTREVFRLFQEHINPNPVYAQLWKVIYSIVFDKGIGSDMLLFGLKYYIEKKIPLNYPQGLYYVMQNRDMQNAYYKWKAKKTEVKVEITEDAGVEFVHKPVKKKGLEDIFK